MKTFCFAIGTALLLLGNLCAAQSSYVEGVTAIINSGTNATQIETYSETFETADIAQYYEAYVQGFVYQDGVLVNDGYAKGYPYWNDAYGYLVTPLHVPDQYDAISDHYVIAYYTVYDPNTGTYEYENPDYFSNDGSYGGSNDFAPGSSSCGCYYEVSDYIYLGSTEVQMSSAPPVINDLSPTGISLGTSGTFYIEGTALVDVFTGNATVTISGSGITWTIASAVASSVAINYSVSASAATGDRTVTVSDRFGSSQAALNVGDGTPHVTGINPDSWQAGQTTTVVFTGYNFGTAPKLSFSSGQVTATITSANNTQITASVSVAAASPYQIVKVTVTSTGYNGSGFISTNGNPPSTQDTATILPIPAPVPKILRNGSNITGTTGIAVVTGQQVYLTTQITAPLTPTSFSWSVGGTNIGGYSIATGTHPATGNIVQTALNQATVKFYWVYAGQGLTVTFRYCMENAECSPNVQATFNVSGVTNAAFGATTPTSDVKINTFTDNCVGDLYYGQTVKWMSLGQLTAEGGTYPNCGFTIPSPGIKFTASGTMPGSGGWKFVQILLTNSETITTTTHAAQTSSCGTGLDNFYPYPFTYLSTNSAQDSPGELISPAPSGTTYTEFKRSFTAKMFSMWQSSTANSIPVPIGYHQWYTIQDGLRSSSGTWSLASDTNWSSGTFVAAAASQSAKGYPTWSTVSINGPCTSYNVATMN